MGHPMLRQSDAKLFKKQLQMKREALKQLNCQAGDSKGQKSFHTVLIRFGVPLTGAEELETGKQLKTRGSDGGRAGTRTPDLLRVKLPPLAYVIDSFEGPLSSS